MLILIFSNIYNDDDFDTFWCCCCWQRRRQIKFIQRKWLQTTTTMMTAAMTKTKRGSHTEMIITIFVVEDHQDKFMSMIEKSGLQMNDQVMGNPSAQGSRLWVVLKGFEVLPTLHFLGLEAALNLPFSFDTSAEAGAGGGGVGVVPSTAARQLLLLSIERRGEHCRDMLSVEQNPVARQWQLPLSRGRLKETPPSERIGWSVDDSKAQTDEVISEENGETVLWSDANAGAGRRNGSEEEGVEEVIRVDLTEEQEELFRR